DSAELEARGDEELGASGERTAANEGLERSHRRRPDGEHALGTADPRPRRGRDLVALAVDAMALEPVLAHRPKRVEADVERDALDVEAGEQLRREVQSRRRRGSRAGLARVHGLVALRVGERNGDV